MDEIFIRCGLDKPSFNIEEYKKKVILFTIIWNELKAFI